MTLMLTDRDEIDLLAVEHDWGISITTEHTATIFDRGSLGTSESGPIVGAEFDDAGQFKQMFFTFDIQSGRGFGSRDIKLLRSILMYEGDWTQST